MRDLVLSKSVHEYKNQSFVEKPPTRMWAVYFFMIFFFNYKEFFKVGAGLNPTVLLALILISSPVCGFLPFLAFRVLTVKVPKLG